LLKLGIVRVLGKGSYLLFCYGYIIRYFFNLIENQLNRIRCDVGRGVEIGLYVLFVPALQFVHNCFGLGSVPLSSGRKS